MTDNYYIMEGTGYYKLCFKVRAGSVGTDGGTIKALPIEKQSYTKTADENFAVNLVDMSEIADGRWYEVTQIVYAANYYYLGIQVPGGNSIYIDDIEMRKVDPSTVIPADERLVALNIGGDDYNDDESTKRSFNFEETKIETGMANSAFSISGDQNHGDIAGKSLKIEKNDAISFGAIMGMLLTTKGKTTGEQYRVEWGKTYRVTLYYKTVGTAPSESWMLGVRTGTADFNSNTTFQAVSNPLMLPTTATGWTKYETTFTATGSGDKTYLGLSVYFPKFNAHSGGYAVYIDDVTVEQTDIAIAQSGTRTFDFGLADDNMSSYANSAFTGSYEEHHGDAANGKSLKIYKDSVVSAGKMGAMLTLKNKSSNFVYNVEWGKTYKVTLWYKTVGTASFDPWQLSMYTNDYDAYSNTSRLTKQTISNSLSFPTAATEWTKFEATFTAEQPDYALKGHTALGIGVEFPAFSDNTDYKVYIDDITVRIWQTGDVSCDGKIDSDDLALLREVLLGVYDEKEYNCDINNDGIVDIRDLITLKTLLAKESDPESGALFLSDYKVVCPEEDTYRRSYAAEKLGTILSAKYFSNEMTDDSEEQSDGQPEILVGNTNRAESEEALSILNKRKNNAGDYIIMIKNGNIIINATSDYALETAVEHFLEKFCSKDDSAVISSDYYEYHKANIKANTATLNGVDIKNYVFVTPVDKSFIYSREIENFNAMLCNYYGYELPVYNTKRAEHEYEIFVGPVTRAPSAGNLSADQYKVIQSGKKLTVCGGEDWATAAAMQELTTTVFASLSNKKIAVTNLNKTGSYSQKANTYGLAWSDEFNGSDINTKYWNRRSSAEQIGRDGMPYAYNSDPEYTFVRNGNAVLNSKKIWDASIDNYRYHTAGISTENKVTFQYGYYEMRAKLPKDNGSVSFWTQGIHTGISAPFAEVDVVENFAQSDAVYANVHDWYADNGHVAFGEETTKFAIASRKGMLEGGEDFCEAYHTFGCDWTEEKLTFYVDGNKITEIDISTSDMNIFHMPQYLIFGSGTGECSTNKYPLPPADVFSWEYIIESCRIYQIPGVGSLTIK